MSDTFNAGPGWYEVINPRNATTCIALVYEDGSLYFPEGEQVLDRQEFAFAAARGKAHRLVRADEVAATIRQAKVEALREAADGDADLTFGWRHWLRQYADRIAAALHVKGGGEVSDYTPSTAEIRFRVDHGWEPYGDGSFDRWLADHDTEVARKAKAGLLRSLVEWFQGSRWIEPKGEAIAGLQGWLTRIETADDD